MFVSLKKKHLLDDTYSPLVYSFASESKNIIDYMLKYQTNIKYAWAKDDVLLSFDTNYYMEADWLDLAIKMANFPKIRPICVDELLTECTLYSPSIIYRFNGSSVISQLLISAHVEKIFASDVYLSCSNYSIIMQSHFIY